MDLWEVIRKSMRPPGIPTEMWCKAKSKQRQRWLRQYEKKLEEDAADGGILSIAVPLLARAAQQMGWLRVLL